MVVKLNVGVMQIFNELPLVLKILTGVFVFLLGSCIGSFMNVCIWRIPLGESVIFAPSHCVKCHYQIKWYENIPIFSYLMLRGRCSNCKEPYTSRYFWVELVCGLLFLGLFVQALKFPNAGLVMLPEGFIGVFLAVCTFFIDLKHRRIPDKITISVMIMSVLAAFLLPGSWNLANHWLSFAFSLGSLFIGGGILLLFAWAGEKILQADVMGGGDIKFVAAVAALTGLIGTFFVLLISSVAASLVGVWLILRHRGTLKSSLPYGAFMAAVLIFWLFRYYVAWILNTLGVISFDVQLL